MTKLSISKAWDETRAVVARDGGLLTTIALALFVLPGVISDVATPAAPSGLLPEFGYWTILTAISLVFGGALVWMLIAVPVGILSALRPRSLLDRFAMVGVLIAFLIAAARRESGPAAAATARREAGCS